MIIAYLLYAPHFADYNWSMYISNQYVYIYEYIILRNVWSTIKDTSTDPVTAEVQAGHCFCMCLYYFSDEEPKL